MMLSNSLLKYRYLWPYDELTESSFWEISKGNKFMIRQQPESHEDLAKDSRWPAFFPSPICFITASDGSHNALEKVVGATIVNRFPYILAISLCKHNLSERHYCRHMFSTILEQSRSVAVQFLPPGLMLDKLMDTIINVPEDKTYTRIAKCGLKTRKALTNDAPIFTAAYLVYEATLVKPSKDIQGNPIYMKPWIDVGSHRVYFLEIKAIQLEMGIAQGQKQILWRSLPAWKQISEPKGFLPDDHCRLQEIVYQKPYTSHYTFPSTETIAFEADTFENLMAVKYFSPLAADQIEVDNAQARWPCFFPSSLGMITSWAGDNLPNMMPCGSTMVLSRYPLVIAPCISYAAINERYSPRATLNMILETRKFGCGVPFIHDLIIKAIQYSGTVSFRQDPDKITHSGLEWHSTGCAPVLNALPIHFDCHVIEWVRLGTHIMFIGKVETIRVRSDVNKDNPLEWCPWPDVITSNG